MIWTPRQLARGFGNCGDIEAGCFVLLGATGGSRLARVLKVSKPCLRPEARSYYWQKHGHRAACRRESNE
jgi:hypothetical protein